MPPLDIEPVEGNPFAPAAQPFLDAAQATRRPYIEITPNPRPQTGQVRPDVLASGFAGGIAPVRSAPQAAQPFLDMAALMGQRSPLAGGVGLPSPDPGGFAPSGIPGQAGGSDYRREMGNLAKEAGNFGSPLDWALELGGGPGAGPAMAMAAGPAVKKLAQQGEAEIAQGIAKFIRAYHGSPYDFERFDLSKIGTGEGAQAYGHGLYFAENPSVAKEYRDQITQLTTDAARRAIEQGGDIDAAIAETQRRINHYSTMEVKKVDESTRQSLLKINQQKLEELRAQKAGAEPNPGRMYEVSISADPDHFLHWDKPLSEQSPHVQKFFGYQKHDITDEMIAARRAKGDNGTADFLEAQRRHYDMLGAQKPADIYNLNEPSVVERLREGGIPGIKYQDQGSRGYRILSPQESTSGKWVVGKWPGGGPEQRYFEPNQEAEARAYFNEKNTHNYVVFDDKLINIVRKFGMAGLTALGAGYELVPIANDRDPFQAK